MSSTAHAYPRDHRVPCTGRVRGATTSLVLVLFACIALSACGGSSKPSRPATKSAAAAAPTTTTTATSAAPTPAPTKAAQTAQQRASILRILNCMRRHGIHMPEPDAAGKVSLRGINVKSRHYQAVGSACFNNPSK